MTDTKRYFTVDDGGCDYTIVARDVEHAKQIMRDSGVEFTKEDGDSAPVDDPAFDSLEWVELLGERLYKIRVHQDDNASGPTVPLIDCNLGDWFSSEF
jgi:hypothetical protein